MPTNCAISRERMAISIWIISRFSTVNTERVYVNVMFRLFALRDFDARTTRAGVNLYTCSLLGYACTGSYSECVLTTDRNYRDHRCREACITMNCYVLDCHWETLTSLRVASPIESTVRSQEGGGFNVIAEKRWNYRFGLISRGDYRATDIRGNNRLSLFRH